jgi:ubiquinone/menaquinone biosynthesis C-methylase UbiE
MIFHIRQALAGKTLVRSMMNKALMDFELPGKVLDLGGGGNPSYLHFINKGKSFKRLNIDIDEDVKDRIKVNLEHDRLPFEDATFKNVLMLNLLEHIYNHKHALREARRVLEVEGTIIGFVPFLIKMHKDPNDYFRYTEEALERISQEVGFRSSTIKPIGLGPFSVSYNTFVSVFPNILFIWYLPLAFIMDKLLLLFRSNLKHHFPLGYLFIMKK